MNGFIRRPDFSSLGTLATIIIVLLLGISPVSATDLTLLGRWSNGPCVTVAQLDDLIVAGNGTAVELLRLGATGSVTAIGKIILPHLVEHVAVIDTLVLASCGEGGLQVISVADPATPILLGAWTAGGAVHAAAGDGRYAFLAGDGQTLRVLDLFDPGLPVSVFSSTTSINATAIVLQDGLVYVGDDAGDLHVYDIVDARHPEQTDWFGQSSDVYDIVVQDGRAYLAQGPLGLLVIDVSDPYDIDDIGLLPLPAGWALGVDVSGNRAYVAAAGGGLRVIDITDPAAMVEVSSCETGGYGRAALVWSLPPNAVLVLMADSWLGLSLIVPYTIQQPTVLTTALDRADARRVAIDASLVAIVDHDVGVRLLDADPPGAPLELATIHLSYARDVDLDSGLMAVARERMGWSLVDVSTPDQPEILATVETPGLVRSVVLDRGYAWLADGDSGFRIYDLAVPSSPVEVGVLQVGANLLDVAISEDLAVLIDENAGLLVIDIFDPAEPALIGEMFLPGTPLAVALGGDEAFVALGAAGFSVVSLAAPAVPELVTTVATPASARDLSMSEGFLSVACGSQGVRVYDGRDPADPFLVASKVTNNGTGVVSRERRIYLVDGFDGLWLLRNELVIAIEDPDQTPTPRRPPSAVQLSSPAPNPANPGTSITFSLAAPSPVRVTIHDLRGRLVRSLFDGSASAGERTLRWDGRDDAGRLMSSGAYVVRVVSERGEASRPLGLVR